MVLVGANGGFAHFATDMASIAVANQVSPHASGIPAGCLQCDDVDKVEIFADDRMYECVAREDLGDADLYPAPDVHAPLGIVGNSVPRVAM